MKLRKRFWGVLGSLAMMTGVVCAGETQPINATAPLAGSAAANQKVADDIAAAIAGAVSDHGYTVSLDFRGGIVTLHGTVSSPHQMRRIVEVTRSRPGVKRVVNELTLVPAGTVQTTSYQEAGGAPAPMPMAPGSSGQMMNAAVPEFSMPQGAPPQYDAPYLPPFAWPAKAPYPNYSAVQYPKSYPPNAWPNIGPFYPYPEAPLDWREVKAWSWGCHLIDSEKSPPGEWRQVKLRWDDGHWYLSFHGNCWHPLGFLKGMHNCEQPEPIPCGTGLPGSGYHLCFKKTFFTHLYMNE